MKQKLQNASAYVECLLKNKFTRTGIIFVIIGATLLILKHPYIAIPFLIIGFVILILLLFGLSSYAMYERTFNHMLTYDAPVTMADTYCGSIGVTVAERRFKKQYPKRYEKIAATKKIIEQSKKFQFFAIEIHMRGRNL